ncbi:hypothetical protein VaNZ11_002383, partial [Volvox africanus]
LTRLFARLQLDDGDEWMGAEHLSSCQPVACASEFGPKWSDDWSDPYELSDRASALEHSLRRRSICSAQFSLDADESHSSCTATSSHVKLGSALRALDVSVSSEHTVEGPLGAPRACAGGVSRRLEQLPWGADFLPPYMS